ncbi:beta strand repeat-containing protein [Kineosporia succinea]|uniref:Big-1 domain-containing protein n=1 Tax=Kineosporia succinea TaxID=84632 RepID=A0ABT9P1B3_9ACTN|nr:hypothetical protein [Kineosporia succinea]MDP9826467.1 hypothetical protein [Kineosporia succinea]
MNLQSKKARIPIAALGVTALCSSGLGIFASAAQAAVSITLSPGTTSVTTANYGDAAVTQGAASSFNIPAPLSNATYATRVTSTGLTSLKVVVESFTPSGGATPADAYVYYGTRVTGGTLGLGPVPASGADNGPWSRINALGATEADRTTASLPLTSGANADNIFFTAQQPGTYKMHFLDSGAQAGTDDDNTSPTITLTVKDATTQSAGNTDDVAPTVTTNKASVGVGDPITATADLSAWTLTDSRGTSDGAGVLGSQLNKLVGIGLAGAGLGAGANTPTVGTWKDGKSSRTTAVNGTNAAGTVTATATFDRDGDGTPDALPAGAVGTTATTTVASTGVTSIPKLEATAVTGAVVNGAGTVSVKAGTKAITYKATVANSGTATDIANKNVYFTVAGADAANVTTSGTTVDAANRIYSATTDASGVATITLTDNAATPSTYTVAASSNGQASGGAGNAVSLTTTYAAAAIDAVKITSSSADLTPTVGTASVTVKGKLVDQFGADYKPSGNDSLQVAVSGAATANTPVTDGTFSYTYTPTTPPTAGTPQTLTFTYGAKTVNAVINWASSAAAASITLTTPADKATGQTLQTSASPANNGLAIAGTVLDASNAGLAFKGVKLTGGEGVWFSKSATPDADSPLVESLDTVANGSGALTGAYVFFTKAGEHKVTATSGSATATSTVTVSAPVATAGWNVEMADASGDPGSTLIVSGKVTDVFGNAVQNATVTLSQEPTTIGSLAATNLTTNAAGVFSTTFVSGSNAKGDVDVTAEITNNAATLTPNAAWKTAGVTLKDGVDKVESTIAVARAELTLSSSGKLVSGPKGASAKLSGTFTPNSTVDIYAKASGELAYQWTDSVKTDDEGEWGAEVQINKSTRFIAKANGLSSPSTETQLWADVILTAKALGKGKVELFANGDPNVKGTLSFYRSIAGTDPLLKKITASDFGSGKTIVPLPKGGRSVYVVYKAPGVGAAQSKTLKITVK